MELRQLRYFIKTKELLSFTQAAKSLHITQSTLSQQIKQLEIELDVPLFNRVGKRIALTEAGEYFSRYAAESIQRAEDGLSLLKDLDNIQKGTIRIGVTHGLRNVIVTAVKKFAPRYPGIHIQISYGTSEVLISKLDELVFDFVLVFNEDRHLPGLKYLELFDSRLVYLTQKTKDFMEREIGLDQIAEVPMAIATEGFEVNNYFRQLFSQAFIDKDFMLKVNDISTVLELVKSGLYHSIMVETSVGDQLVQKIPIKGINMFRTAMVLSKEEVYEKKSVKEFFKILKEAGM